MWKSYISSSAYKVGIVGTKIFPEIFEIYPKKGFLDFSYKKGVVDKIGDVLKRGYHLFSY